MRSSQFLQPLGRLLDGRAVPLRRHRLDPRAARRGSGAAIRASGDVFVIPLAAGLSFVYGDFLVEARFTWRQSFGEHLVARADGSHASLATWATTLAPGYEF